MEYHHVPVMLSEIISFLEPKAGEKFIDCTLGGAGYSTAIASMIGEEGRVLALDLDDLALENARKILKEKNLNNVLVVRSNFKNLDKAAESVFPKETLFDGIVFDLGLSSAQLDDEKRGFSFKDERPLDMSFGQSAELSTREIVNSYSVLELADIFKRYGDQEKAENIAREIVSTRKKKSIETTTELLSIIEKVIPFQPWLKINPGTKVFQALRMETNKELEALEIALEKASSKLKAGGRLVVVSFHSGEDRVVKNFFRERKNKDFKILSKKPLVASDLEVSNNPRARSAKLRVGEKI